MPFYILKWHLETSHCSNSLREKLCLFNLKVQNVVIDSNFTFFSLCRKIALSIVDGSTCIIIVVGLYGSTHKRVVTTLPRKTSSHRLLKLSNGLGLLISSPLQIFGLLWNWSRNNSYSLLFMTIVRIILLLYVSLEIKQIFGLDKFGYKLSLFSSNSLNFDPHLL